MNAKRTLGLAGAIALALLLSACAEETASEGADAGTAVDVTVSIADTYRLKVAEVGQTVEIDAWITDASDQPVADFGEFEWRPLRRDAAGTGYTLSTFDPAVTIEPIRVGAGHERLRISSSQPGRLTLRGGVKGCSEAFGEAWLEPVCKGYAEVLFWGGVAPTRLVLSTRDLQLAVGERRAFVALPWHADQPIPRHRVTYTSARPDIATVDPHGRVTAHAPGTTEIRVEAGPLAERLTVTATAGAIETHPEGSHAFPLTWGDGLHFEPSDHITAALAAQGSDRLTVLGAIHLEGSGAHRAGIGLARWTGSGWGLEWISEPWQQPIYPAQAPSGAVVDAFALGPFQAAMATDSRGTEYVAYRDGAQGLVVVAERSADGREGWTHRSIPTFVGAAALLRGDRFIEERGWLPPWDIDAQVYLAGLNHREALALQPSEGGGLRIERLEMVPPLCIDTIFLDAVTDAGISTERLDQQQVPRWQGGEGGCNPNLTPPRFVTGRAQGSAPGDLEDVVLTVPDGAASQPSHENAPATPFPAENPNVFAGVDVGPPSLFFDAGQRRYGVWAQGLRVRLFDLQGQHFLDAPTELHPEAAVPAGGAEAVRALTARRGRLYVLVTQTDPLGNATDARMLALTPPPYPDFDGAEARRMVTDLSHTFTFQRPGIVAQDGSQLALARGSEGSNRHRIYRSTGPGAPFALVFPTDDEVDPEGDIERMFAVGDALFALGGSSVGRPSRLRRSEDDGRSWTTQAVLDDVTYLGGHVFSTGAAVAFAATCPPRQLLCYGPTQSGGGLAVPYCMPDRVPCTSVSEAQPVIPALHFSPDVRAGAAFEPQIFEGALHSTLYQDADRMLGYAEIDGALWVLNAGGGTPELIELDPSNGTTLQRMAITGLPPGVTLVGHTLSPTEDGALVIMAWPWSVARVSPVTGAASMVALPETHLTLDLGAPRLNPILRTEDDRLVITGTTRLPSGALRAFYATSEDGGLSWGDPVHLRPQGGNGQTVWATWPQPDGSVRFAVGDNGAWTTSLLRQRPVSEVDAAALATARETGHIEPVAPLLPLLMEGARP